MGRCAWCRGSAQRAAAGSARAAASKTAHSACAAPLKQEYERCSAEHGPAFRGASRGPICARQHNRCDDVHALVLEASGGGTMPAGWTDRTIAKGVAKGEGAAESEAEAGAGGPHDRKGSGERRPAGAHAAMAGPAARHRPQGGRPRLPRLCRGMTVGQGGRAAPVNALGCYTLRLRLRGIPETASAVAGGYAHCHPIIPPKISEKSLKRSLACARMP